MECKYYIQYFWTSFFGIQTKLNSYTTRMLLFAIDKVLDRMTMYKIVEYVLLILMANAFIRNQDLRI